MTVLYIRTLLFLANDMNSARQAPKQTIGLDAAITCHAIRSKARVCMHHDKMSEERWIREG